jgi:hypothetical protein
MILPPVWIAITVAMSFALGLLLVWAGRFLRQRHGLGAGRTLALDNVALVSRRWGLTGWMDRVMKGGGTIIPEAWKSAHAPRPGHRAQMDVYFLLIEDQLRVRPAYGVVVCGDPKHLGAEIGFLAVLHQGSPGRRCSGPWRRWPRRKR